MAEHFESTPEGPEEARYTKLRDRLLEEGAAIVRQTEPEFERARLVSELEHLRAGTLNRNGIRYLLREVGGIKERPELARAGDFARLVGRHPKLSSFFSEHRLGDINDTTMGTSPGHNVPVPFKRLSHMSSEPVRQILDSWVNTYDGFDSKEEQQAYREMIPQLLGSISSEEALRQTEAYQLLEQKGLEHSSDQEIRKKLESALSQFKQLVLLELGSSGDKDASGANEIGDLIDELIKAIETEAAIDGMLITRLNIVLGGLIKEFGHEFVSLEAEIIPRVDELMRRKRQS